MRRKRPKRTWKRTAQSRANWARGGQFAAAATSFLAPYSSERASTITALVVIAVSQGGVL
jgi:hypothetical protein